MVQRVARVLHTGSAFCIALVHPVNRPQQQLADYFAEHRISDHVKHDGARMTFVGINRPFEAYTQALHDAVARVPRLASAMRRPFFLHMRCRLANPPR